MSLDSAAVDVIDCGCPHGLQPDDTVASPLLVRKCSGSPRDEMSERRMAEKICQRAGRG